MSSPRFTVGDAIYLTESARLGCIEAYGVASVVQKQDGQWYYRVCIPSRPAMTNNTFGDRITLRRELNFELAETELCTYCEAVDLALAAAQLSVTRLQQLKQQCEETNGST